jgi:hypothetical protein
MATLPAWFVGAPVVGGPDTYQVVEATTSAQYAQYQSEKYAGPYATKALAQADASARGQAAADPAGAFSPSNIASTASSAADDIPGVKDAEQAVGSVEDFLGGLTSANLWIRVAKVAIGSMILIVGLVHLTGLNTKVSGVTKTAIKAAPLLAV